MQAVWQVCAEYAACQHPEEGRAGGMCPNPAEMWHGTQTCFRQKSCMSTRSPCSGNVLLQELEETNPDESLRFAREAALYTQNGSENCRPVAS